MFFKVAQSYKIKMILSEYLIRGSVGSWVEHINHAICSYLSCDILTQYMPTQK